MPNTISSPSNTPITPPTTTDASDIQSIAQESTQNAAPIYKDPIDPAVADKTAKGSKQNANTRKKDADMQGTILRDSLNKKIPAKTKQPAVDVTKLDLSKLKEEKKTDFGQDIQNITKDIIRTPQEKVESTRKMLVATGKEDLQRIFKDSEQWPADSRRILIEAMRSPDVMSRIGKEFPKDQSLKALNLAINPKEGFPEESNPGLKSTQEASRNVALGSWMTAAPGPTVDDAIRSRNESLPKILGYQMESGNHSNFDKLDHTTKAFVLSVLSRDPSVQFHSVGEAFNRLGEDEKNHVFNNWQGMGPHVLPDVLSKFSKEKLVHVGFMNGLDKDNVRQMRETYVVLADGAKTKEDADVYRQTAQYLKTWMEDRKP